MNEFETKLENTWSSRLVKVHLQAKHSILSGTSLSRLNSRCPSWCIASRTVWNAGRYGTPTSSSLQNVRLQLIQTCWDCSLVAGCLQGWVYLHQPNQNFIVWTQVENRAVFDWFRHCCRFSLLWILQNKLVVWFWCHPTNVAVICGLADIVSWADITEQTNFTPNMLALHQLT